MLSIRLGLFLGACQVGVAAPGLPIGGPISSKIRAPVRVPNPHIVLGPAVSLTDAGTGTLRRAMPQAWRRFSVWSSPG